MSDAINPQHYKRLPAEAIDIIESAIDNAPSNQAALLHGQVLKYVLRCWGKNGIEDLCKAKWYLDRLIGSFNASEPEQPKAQLASDKIPEGYRKLNDSSEDPRQLGDLRWSVAAKRYVEIGGDEIGYANRDNWAACRKITGEATGEVAVEVTGEVKPPEGWRWLEVGEVIRKGDLPWADGWVYATEPIMLGMALPEHWKPIIRRNKFEVGEKVVHVPSEDILEVVEVVEVAAEVKVADIRGSVSRYYPEVLAPYIEEAK